MIKLVAVNGICNGKARPIYILALFSMVCDVLCRYQISPEFVVSTSDQNGATNFIPPPSGNEF